jgi:hypothetical protein
MAAMKMLNAKDLSLEELKKFAPSIARCIDRIVESAPERLTGTWLLQEVDEGRQDLWLIMTENDDLVMVAFSHLQHYQATGYTFMKIIGLAGDKMEDAWPLLEEFEAFARSAGAESIEIVGRPGWARCLKDHGYEHKSTNLSKSLN